MKLSIKLEMDLLGVYCNWRYRYFKQFIDFMRFGNSIAWQITFRLLTNFLLCLFWNIQAKITETDTICFKWNRGFPWPCERGHFERKNNGMVFHESTCIYSHVENTIVPFEYGSSFQQGYVIMESLSSTCKR